MSPILSSYLHTYIRFANGTTRVFPSALEVRRYSVGGSPLTVGREHVGTES